MSKIIFEIYMLDSVDPKDLLVEPDEITASGNAVYRFKATRDQSFVSAVAEMMAQHMSQAEELSSEDSFTTHPD